MKGNKFEEKPSNSDGGLGIVMILALCVLSAYAGMMFERSRAFGDLTEPFLSRVTVRGENNLEGRVVTKYNDGKLVKIEIDNHSIYRTPKYTVVTDNPLTIPAIETSKKVRVLEVKPHTYKGVPIRRAD